MFEQDYLIRLIKDIVRLLARLVLHKEMAYVELPGESVHTSGQSFFKKLITLADNGQINEAENLLYDIDTDDLKNYELALAFYAHINDYSDDYLELCNYTRQEIISGLQEISNQFGISLFDSFTQLLS